ncbi:MAG: hypothetical protein ACJAW3_000579, partial [Lentimonas sp.]
EIIDAEDDEGYVSGAGFKINYNHKYFKADFTYSRGLHSPEYLRNVNNISEDEESIYFNIKFELF